jgi:uncharacterized protein YjbI with pentapeptide repeats
VPSAERPEPPEQVALSLPALTDTPAREVEEDERYDGLRFTEADFSQKDLARTTFADCAFERVTLNETDLRGAHFIESQLSQVEASVLTAPRSSWRRVVLERSRLGAMESYESSWRSLLLRDCKLGYLNARSSVWTDVTFTGCSVDELDVSGAKLTRVAFADCRIGTLHTANATLVDVDLRGARLEVIDGLAGLAGAWVSEQQLTALAPLLADHLKIRVG